MVRICTLPVEPYIDTDADVTASECRSEAPACRECGGQLCGEAIEACGEAPWWCMACAWEEVA